ncbi:ABC transporter G family member 34-like protein [Drosera capensis]
MGKSIPSSFDCVQKWRISFKLLVFLGNQGVSKINDGHNPATWMLEMTTPVQELSLGVDFAETYRNYEQYMRTKALIQELRVAQQGSKELYFPTEFTGFSCPVHGLPVETTLVLLA